MFMKTCLKLQSMWRRWMQMFKSAAFWKGFWSVWNPFGLLFTPYQEYDQRFSLEEHLADSRAVEGDLWRAMNRFEQMFGDKNKTFGENVPSSEDVLARFEAISKEYDSPDILVRCASCGREKRVGKYPAQQTFRCRCGGFMVCCVTQP